MTRTALFLTTALLGLAGAAAGPLTAPPRCSNRPPLYDQDARDDSGIGITSQNFESSFDAYDTEAADDFRVTDTTWFLREVDIEGTYFSGSGPARSETVTLYKNDHGLPGARIARFTAKGVDKQGSFCIPLGQGAMLRKGTYWLSVVADMDFAVSGEWGWMTKTHTVFHPAAWRNPGGGFGVCQAWEAENVCIPNGQGDHIFTLR